MKLTYFDLKLFEVQTNQINWKEQIKCKKKKINKKLKEKKS